MNLSHLPAGPVPQSGLNCAHGMSGNRTGRAPHSHFREAKALARHSGLAGPAARPSQPHNPRQQRRRAQEEPQKIDCETDQVLTSSEIAAPGVRHAKAQQW
jgi:hypothetical protein